MVITSCSLPKLSVVCVAESKGFEHDLITACNSLRWLQCGCLIKPDYNNISNGLSDF